MSRTAASLPPLLRLTNLAKSYGHVLALRRLSLDLACGDCLALFGPNGAGKTTLLKIAASLLSPDDGQVLFKGGGLPRGAVGYVSHQSLLYNDLTGLENLVFYARLYGLRNAAESARSRLARMGLERAGDQLVRGYSRGMRQRLTLARALLHEPPLMLLDEPYSGLDQHGGRLLTLLLRELQAQERTILLVTHNTREGFQLCNRVAILHRGSVAFESPRSELDETAFERIYFDTIGGAAEAR